MDTSTVDSLLKQQQQQQQQEQDVKNAVIDSLSPIAKRPTTLAVNVSSGHSTDTNTPVGDTPTQSEIEEKEHNILQQCLKNELTNAENAGSGATKNADGADIACRESRFPLPDHLNYPICRYRNKSESDNRLHPLRKLRDGWRKLRERKRANKTDSGGDTDCYPEFYPAFVQPEEDDSEVILSRLSRNPNERKNFARRIFARFGSKTYAVSNEKVTENARPIRRSGSTLSVPDAFHDMWKKAHPEVSGEQRVGAPRPLHKVNSMPSINSNNQRHENKENFFVVPQPYSNHGNPMPTNEKRQPSTNPNELRRTLSGLQIATNTNNDKKSVCHNNSGNPTNYHDDLKLGTRNQTETVTPESTNSLVRSTSCHELYNRNNKKTPNNSNYPQVPQQHMFYTPAGPYACYPQSQLPQGQIPPGQIPPGQIPPAALMTGHIPSGAQMHGQVPPGAQMAVGQQLHYMNMGFYPYANYMYPMGQFGGYPMEFFYPGHTNFQGGYPAPGMPGVNVSRDNVVAPLDVKVEHEKKAEKRKIADINFDTFV